MEPGTELELPAPVPTLSSATESLTEPDVGPTPAQNEVQDSQGNNNIFLSIMY